MRLSLNATLLERFLAGEATTNETEDALLDLQEWQAFADVFINWENQELYCAHCNSLIQSAYGE